MLNFTAEQQAALNKNCVMLRKLIWVEARDFNGMPSPAGFWDDVGHVVVGGRTYYGSGGLFQVGALSAKADFSIPGLEVRVSGISDEVLDLVKGAKLEQSPIEFLLGIFDTESHALIPPLIRRFKGRIDDIDYPVAAAGDPSVIVFICESESRALTIKRTATRSPASCAERDPADRYYEYTASQREQALYFGRKGTPPSYTPAQIVKMAWS